MYCKAEVVYVNHEALNQEERFDVLWNEKAPSEFSRPGVYQKVSTRHYDPKVLGDVDGLHVCETIFDLFNTGAQCDLGLRNMSVGDAVVLYPEDGGDPEVYVTEGLGFRKEENADWILKAC